MHQALELRKFCENEYARLVGSLGLFCGNPDLAEELANEALMRACVDWSRVRRMSSPKAWVHSVGMNLARSHFRRKAAERRATERLIQQATPAPSANEADEAILIRRAVASLPSRKRKALVLRYYADLRVEDVAEAMNCSPSTVKSLIRSALHTLRMQVGLEALEAEGADHHAF